MTNPNNNGGPGEGADSAGEAADQGTEQISSDAQKTEQIDADLGDIPYISDAELDARLNGKSESDEGDDSPLEAKDPNKTDDTNEDASDTAADDDQSNADDGKVSREEHENLKKELTQKNRENEANQKFIQTTRSQYGEIKKAVVQQIADIESRLNDMTPGEETEARLDLRSLKSKKQDIEKQESLFEHVVITREEIERDIPEEEWNMDAMVEVLEEQGEDAKYISNYKRNAFAVADAKKIKLLHSAGKYRNAARVLAGALKKAQAENTEKAKAPKRVLANIDKVAKKSTGMTSQNGGARSSGVKNYNALTEFDIANLSEAELNEAIAQTSRR